MAKRRSPRVPKRKTVAAKTAATKRPIEQYEHKDKKRVNNPPVGLVTPETDTESGKRTYQYDPHLDPQLVWAGKAERTSFEVPTVSLHVHERIDPRSIIEAVRKKNGSNYEQLSLFASKSENPPMRDAIDFYKHEHDWSNRLVAGDSLLVMNSLLEKEGLGGQVQMIYMDPPYGIKYGSNFQPFVNKRDVKDGKDEDLTAEPEMIKAFRDTWELGIHSYLSYLRDRFLLAKELLHESGSIFVQISDENVHHVREVLDEVFGQNNFVREIIFTKTRSLVTSKYLTNITDFILWYCKNTERTTFHNLFQPREDDSLASHYQDEKGNVYSKSQGEILLQANPSLKLFAFKSDDLIRETNPDFEITFEKKKYSGGYRTNPEGMQRLIKAGRIFATKNQLRYKFFLNDFPASPLNQLWSDTIGATDKIYIVQTNEKIIQRCILMSTDPGDIVLDPTCGSGTTAYVAEQWGRRWIACDTSRVAITLAKQRLMTATFDYYELAYPEEGIAGGFKYKKVPHITLKSIANNEPPGEETLYDQPFIDKSRARVTGPFTVEAVPAPVVKPLDELPAQPVSDASIARSGETIRQNDWRNELLRTGIRGKAGQRIEFTRVEPLQGTYYLHAEGEIRPNSKGADSVRENEVAYGSQRCVISFGPEHAPLEQRQVALALEEARSLVPAPKIFIFAAFQFDPEAAKDIDETKWPGVTLLKTQMNPDLLIEDLKKARSSNESFWLVGQPDVRVQQIKKGENKDKWQVTVEGFDYFNTKTGQIESGGPDKIAVWMLDTDYDGRSLFPRQVFFPIAGENEGWARLAKTLRAEIDDELIEAYRGNVSLPFFPGAYGRIAVKIIDDRGIESLKIVRVGG